MKLEGFLPAHDPLSPRAAYKSLDPKIRSIVSYEINSLWEADTLTLPSVLQDYRRQIHSFARRVLSPHVMQEDTNQHGSGTAAILQQAGIQGLLSDFLPTPLGSLPLRLLPHSLALVQSIKAEEISAVCGGMGTLIGANALGIAPLIFSGDLGALRRFLIPALRESLKGSPHLFAFAITEPAAGSDVEESHGAKLYRPRTVARRTTGGWLLNGRKVFISGGDIAKSITVFAALEGEGMESWTCFLVHNTMPGFQVARTELKMGQRASSAAELVFDNIFIPDNHVIGKLRTGWGINRAILNTSRLPVAAIALGIARGALEESIIFSTSHTLGGKILMNYQEIQLAVAQMIIDTSAMRALIWQSARSWKPSQAKASIAKVFCSDTAMKVCNTAMDIMGNHALVNTNGVEKRYRDARLTQIYEGTNQINRLAIIEDHMEEFIGHITAGHAA